MRNILIAFVLLLIGIRAQAGEPISIAIALRDNIFIYADSSLYSGVIDTIRLADYRISVGNYLRNKRQFNFNGWCRIEIGDKIGWAVFDQFSISGNPVFVTAIGDSLYGKPKKKPNPKFVPSRPSAYWIIERETTNDGVWIKLAVPPMRLWIFKKSLNVQVEDVYYELIQEFLSRRSDYGMALVLLSQLEGIINQEDNVFFNWDKEPGLWPYGGGALLNFAKEKTYLKLNRVEEAIEALNVIINQYKDQNWYYKHPGHHGYYHGRAGSHAAMEIASVYLKIIKDTTKAKDQYHKVIREYPNEKQRAYEDVHWIDIQASEEINRILKDEPERLFIEANKVVTESTVPAVRSIGYVGIVQSLGAKKLYSQMIDSAKVGIAQNPDDQRNYLTSVLNDFASYIAEAVFDILELNAEIQIYKQFSAFLQTNYAGFRLGAYAILKSANLAYSTNAELETVKQLYKQVLETPFALGINISSKYKSYSSSNSRLRVLEEAGIIDGKITSDNTKLLIGAGPQYPIIRTLRIGDLAKVLYWIKLRIENEDSTRNYTKIKLKDSTIGWVSSKNIRNTNSLFQLKDNYGSHWTSLYSNSRYNPSFPGPDITNPSLINLIPDLTTENLRFYDVNDDKITDMILSQYSNYYMTIDGGSLNRIWRIKDRASSIIVAENKLFLARIKSGIKSFKLSSGESLWSRKFTSLASNVVFFENRLHFVSRHNTVICISGTDGKTLWSSELQIEGSKYSSRRVAAANASALIIFAHNKLFSYDRISGALIWKSRQNHKIKEFVLDDNHIYTFEENNKFAVLGISNGNEIWRFNVRSSRYTSNAVLSD